MPKRRELDGYCDELKIAFEYNGQQHYQYIPFFHKKRSLSEIQNTDKEKEKFCKNIGLLLVVVPHYEAYTDAKLIQFITEKVPSKYHRIFEASSVMKSFYSNLSVFKHLQKIAKQHNGVLLSKLYNGPNGRLKWECSKKHTWECAPLSIKKGSWCPICGGRLLNLKKAKDIAKFREGKCVSEFYINNRIKLEWECKAGHRWEASLDNVEGKNSWCPTCSRTKKLTIDEMKIIAKVKGGKCLSKCYVTNSIKLEWQCKCRYIWKATPGHVKNGTWCPKCANQIIPTIADMREVANQRGGECLSDEYVNAHTKLIWKCKNSHT